MDGDIHVLPVNDLREHLDIGTGCSCNPTIELEGATLIIIHNAFDCREAIEEAKEIVDKLNRGEDVCHT